eukprot:8242286-Karenia_brevis.AAC.1
MPAPCAGSPAKANHGSTQGKTPQRVAEHLASAGHPSCAGRGPMQGTYQQCCKACAGAARWNHRSYVQGALNPPPQAPG